MKYFLNPKTLLTSITLSAASFAAQMPRPTQYVVLAFDGSKNIDFWKESRQFAQDNQIPFTYFISGVYWLSDGNSRIYKHPDTGAAKSCIGYGSTTAEVQQRVQQVNLAYNEKNEIASHANGHCEGAHNWSQSKWDSEFNQFYTFVFDTFRINNFAGSYSFNKSDIVGFRAPFLETSKAMWDTLKAFNYRYDTSQSGSPNYWPRKKNSVWNFPLAEIPVAGTGKHTLSMDYNFYYSDSRGNNDAAHSELYYKRMLQSYKNYFAGNYYGNRAPIHIGHHFSKWNGGAYWRAMQDFAKGVCNLPEVKCVTYEELADQMDKLTDETINAYQAGNFPRLSRPSAETTSLMISGNMDNLNLRHIDLNLKLEGKEEQVNVLASGQDARFLKSYKVSIELDDEKISSGALSVKADSFLKKIAPQGSRLSAVVKTFDGLEIQRTTQMIYKDLSGKNFFMGTEDLEERVLKGDLPEAHTDEE